MIITKEQQEVMLDKYMKDHNIYECQGFVDGMKAMIELIQKIENGKSNNNK